MIVVSIFFSIIPIYPLWQHAMNHSVSLPTGPPRNQRMRACLADVRTGLESRVSCPFGRVFSGQFFRKRSILTLFGNHNRDPNVKALKRRGLINHGSTLCLKHSYKLCSECLGSCLEEFWSLPLQGSGLGGPDLGATGFGRQNRIPRFILSARDKIGNYHPPRYKTWACLGTSVFV